MTESNTSESSFNSNCRISSWMCLGSAIAYTLTLIAAIYLIQLGALSNLSPVKLLNFIPANVIIWRITLLLSAIANLSFVAFIVALKETFEQRLRLFANIAVSFSCVSSASMLMAVFSMMVLFADLSLIIHTQSDYLRSDVSQLAWMTLDQALSQAVLISNSLQAICGIIIFGCIVSSDRYANWLGWLAFPVTVFCLSLSIVTFMGWFQWSLFLGFATTAIYVLWLLILGYMLHGMARLNLHQNK